MRIGIIGLPNVGKSAFFNLITSANAKVDRYPFTTIEKNIGVVPVPDERLQILAQIVQPKIVTKATIEFTDIAGLVKGASQGEGLGNKFLANIRETHLLFHIIRNFEDGDIPHSYETIDPRRDLEIVETELVLADLEVVERAIKKIGKAIQNPEDKKRLAILEKIESILVTGYHTLNLTLDESKIIKEFGLLVSKPVIYGINCSSDKPVSLEPELKSRNPILFSVRLEEEMKDFSLEEKIALRQSIGLAPEGPEKIIQECFARLNLIRFYTIKGEETRAWSIEAGTKIIDAAGKIHSDLKERFIKAEVIQFSDLLKTGNFLKAKEEGRVRIEGKEYIVSDGDVVLIKFGSK